MTINELEAMLATISTQRMGEVLTMKMPEDKTSEFGSKLAGLTARVANIENAIHEDETAQKAEDDSLAVDQYFEDILK